jgi:hypothetical protein
VKTSTSDAPGTPNKASSLISKETPSEAMTRHQPDYEATIDHGTSYETLPFASIANPFANSCGSNQGNFPRCPSASWMAVSLATLSPAPFSPVPLPISRPALSGM